MEISDNKIYINVENAQRGLCPMWTSLKGFEIAGEDKVFYPAFAEIAEKEGFKEVAVMYRMIAKVENMHEDRYKALLARVQSNGVFSREEAIDWQCRNCGFVISSKNAPKTCPACLHPQAYFEPLKWNF